MKYLKITNKGKVEREFWELVGASDKNKENNSLIGFKDSGAKFAVVPAMRLGVDYLITSQDSIGLYTLKYLNT